MKINFILLVFGVCQIFGNENATTESYDPDEDSGLYLTKVMFAKLNTLLYENYEIRKQLMDINNRINDLPTSIQATSIPINNSKETSGNQMLNEASWNDKWFKLNGNWSVIQRRQDGSVDFNRKWAEYKEGFGNPNGEFFLGLDKLHEMTTNDVPQELLIILKDFNNHTRYAKYNQFIIGNEEEKYVLKEIGEYSGDAGDSLREHVGQKFSTKDQDNDSYEGGSCAEIYKGGWWFRGCFSSHLNGPYSSIKTSDRFYWNSWTNEYPLQFVEMMIRPKSKNDAIICYII